MRSVRTGASTTGARSGGARSAGAKPARQRSVLHVDLDPFFVSVERSLDPSLRDRPLVIGGEAGEPGIVAAASAEAREQGVAPGQSLARAQQLCPTAVFRRGDLDAYARISEEVTAILLAASRRVERPSADEAYLELTPEGREAPSPVARAEAVKDELQRRLGLDASFGLASSRLAARIASRRARPRGLLIILPGYEASFLGHQPVAALPELPSQLEAALVGAGFATLGSVAAADPAALAAAVGASAAARVQSVARGEGEPEIAVAAPPSWIQEETQIRDRRSDAAALVELLDGLAERAARRLRPFGLLAGSLTVEIARGAASDRRQESFEPTADSATLSALARQAALPLLDPPGGVRGIRLRLTRLGVPSRQVPLFQD